MLVRGPFTSSDHPFSLNYSCSNIKMTRARCRQANTSGLYNRVTTCTRTRASNRQPSKFTNEFVVDKIGGKRRMLGNELQCLQTGLQSHYKEQELLLLSPINIATTISKEQRLLLSCYPSLIVGTRLYYDKPLLSTNESSLLPPQPAFKLHERPRCTCLISTTI